MSTDMSTDGESIEHTVAFRLKASVDERDFLRRAAALGALPGVLDFRILRQVSAKNDFEHALAMRFASRADYDAYDAHPEHRRFVNEVWLPDVAAFLELDYVAADPAP